MKQHLHVSIGPVQGFVAQSRRTRDLWASSYLLSFLASHAMHGAREAGGQIIRPSVEGDPLLALVQGDRAGQPPALGSLPNQFTVEMENLDAAMVAEAVEHRFHEAWRRVCDAVWRKYVARAASAGDGTEAIWKRQTEAFWEVAWIAGAPDDHGLLARRKLWRAHWLPEEAGQKCTMMPELQELSGFVRASARVKQEAFWAELRGGDHLLAERERLCAIALVKRYYPLVARDALGWDLDVTHWPSTVDVAAAPWCLRVLEDHRALGESYAGAVLTAFSGARRGGVSSLVGRAYPDAGRFLTLDCDWFRPAFVGAELEPSVAAEDEPRDEELRRSLLSQLGRLTKVAGAPSVYFALLLADGDQLGKLVREAGSEAVSSALAKFTQGVPNIVRSRHGVTVYAGGDDVLALLPVDGAVECARELEQLYRRCFGEVPATLSSSVVCAHVSDPLSPTLREAHRLLDEVAKTQNGRASLVVAVRQRGTVAIEWATTWERTSVDGTRKDAVSCLEDLRRALGGEEDASLSGSLVYALRDLLSVLCGDASTQPGGFAVLGDGIELMALLEAEIGHRMTHGERALQSDAKPLAALTADVLRRSRRDERLSSHVGVDGLLLARFLAREGTGRGHGQ